MTKQTIIPVGYRITVTTWENDADNYRTEVSEGMSQAEAVRTVELLKGFTHSTDYDNQICNLYDPSEDELARVAAYAKSYFQKFPQVLADFAVSLEEVLADDEAARDCLTELLYDYGVTNGEFYTRVVAEIKVEYVAAQIILDDVTDQFLNEQV